MYRAIALERATGCVEVLFYCGADLRHNLQFERDTYHTIGEVIAAWVCLGAMIL